MTKQHIGVRLTTRDWRQVAIAITDEHIKKASKVWDRDDGDGDDDGVAEAEDDTEEELNIFEHILVRQSAHGSRVAKRHYAVDGAFLNTLSPELINAYS